MGQQITMNMQIIQLLALAGIAIYLILKLRGVLGTRDGHEGPRAISRHTPMIGQSLR